MGEAAPVGDAVADKKRPTVGGGGVAEEAVTRGAVGVGGTGVADARAGEAVAFGGVDVAAGGRGVAEPVARSAAEVDSTGEAVTRGDADGAAGERVSVRVGGVVGEAASSAADKAVAVAVGEAGRGPPAGGWARP